MYGHIDSFFKYFDYLSHAASTDKIDCYYIEFLKNKHTQKKAAKMKFVFFIILTFNYCVKAELIGVKEPTQIVGGAPAPKPGQFPYQVLNFAW